MFAKSARFYDAIYSFKDYVKEARLLHDVISRTAPHARTLLDVACGTGLHLERWRGTYEVEGMDLDPEMVRLASERNPGVPVHEADMTDFDLGKTYDVVTCLFSSIGYAGTSERLFQATAAMARHVAPGGTLLVEPWIRPDDFVDGFADALVVDFEGGKIVRAAFSRRKGDQSILDLHYLVGAPDSEVDHFSERHVMGLFSNEQYEEAIRRAGLDLARYDPEGPMGRGLFVAVRPT